MVLVAGAPSAFHAGYVFDRLRIKSLSRLWSSFEREPMVLDAGVTNTISFRDVFAACPQVPNWSPWSA